MTGDRDRLNSRRTRRSAITGGLGALSSAGCLGGEFSNGTGDDSGGTETSPGGDSDGSGEPSPGSTGTAAGPPAAVAATVSSPTTETHPDRDLQFERMTVSDHDLTGTADVFIDVAVPDDYDPSGSAYRALYVLPVEPGVGDQFGNGLQEAQRVVFENRRQGIHNYKDWVLVRPTFNVPPWYGNHGNGKTKQRTHMTDVVVPAVESQYNLESAPDGRLLMGYSKSGFGAFSLIAHRPDVFGYAQSWDAPLDMDPWFTNWGIKETFGTEQAFVNQHPRSVLTNSPGPFQSTKRLILDGHNLFGTMPDDHRETSKPEHTNATHQYLTDAEIKHVYTNSIQSGHAWISGGGHWMGTASDQLSDLTGTLD